MKNRLVRLAVGTCILLGGWTQGTRASYGALNLTLTKTINRPLLLAISPFVSEKNKTLAFNIVTIVGNNLQKSGFFKLAQAPSKKPPTGDGAPPSLDIQITGAVQQSSHELSVSVKAIDMVRKTTLAEYTCKNHPQKWRQVAHEISDHVYEKITHQKGHFNTKIAYVYKKKGHQRNAIALMDQDGDNKHVLVEQNAIMLTPSFSKDGRYLTYLSFENKNQATVHVMDLHTRKTQGLFQAKTLTFSPRFFPNGQGLVFSQSYEGQTYLSTYDFSSQKIRVLMSSHGSINTSATFSPAGEELVFNSDKDGSPQLYRCFLQTPSSSYRISNGPGSYYAPSWSPYGHWIAFIKQHQGMFYLGIMRPDGSNERILANYYLLESPSWSSNGRYIAFSGKWGPEAPFEIYTFDLLSQGGRCWKMPLTGGSFSHPSWSSGPLP